MKYSNNNNSNSNNNSNINIKKPISNIKLTRSVSNGRSNKTRLTVLSTSNVKKSQQPHYINTSEKTKLDHRQQYLNMKKDSSLATTKKKNSN